MELNRKKHDKVWKVFCEKNFKEIDSPQYNSLLEMLLSDMNSTLFEQYEKVKKCMLLAYENRDLQRHEIDKKDFSHENRIRQPSSGA